MSCWNSCKGCQEGGLVLQVAVTEAETSVSPRGTLWEHHQAGLLGIEQRRCGEWAVLSADDRPGLTT